MRDEFKSIFDFGQFDRFTVKIEGNRVGIRLQLKTKKKLDPTIKTKNTDNTLNSRNKIKSSPLLLA